MEIAKLILEFLKALTWPMVVITSFVVFRGELRTLVGSLQKLKLPGVAKLDWHKQVLAAEEAAEKVEASPKLSHTPRKENEVYRKNILT
jgi:hypothetical protein